MYQDYSGSQQIPTVEGEINIKRVGSGFWDGGNDGTPLDETASAVARSPSPHGAFSYAQSAAVWRAREEEALSRH